MDKEAVYNVSLTDLYKGVWRHLPYPGAKKPGMVNVADPFTSSGEETVAKADQAVSPVFGTPMFFEISIGGIKLPNAPLITVTGSKNIIKTKVAGGDFSVKEIISLDDYRINIKGIAVNEPGQRANSGLVPSDYPEDWVRMLRELYERNEAQPVTCALLSYFGIDRLVIEDVSFPGTPGAQSYVPYEINACSDVAVELELKSKAGEVR